MELPSLNVEDLTFDACSIAGSALLPWLKMRRLVVGCGLLYV